MFLVFTTLILGFIYIIKFEILAILAILCRTSEIVIVFFDI